MLKAENLSSIAEDLANDGGAELRNILPAAGPLADDAVSVDSPLVKENGASRRASAARPASVILGASNGDGGEVTLSSSGTATFHVTPLP